MSRHTLGACAQAGNAKAELCDPVPEGMSIEAAGVFRGAYATAYHALLQRGRLKEGEWVLVHGAAGGIGIAAIQVAKLFGAKVIATASTDEKRRACLEEGADHAIGYHGGFLDAVKELTGGRGVDVVYDPIGAEVAEEFTALPRLVRPPADPGLSRWRPNEYPQQLSADQGHRCDRRAHWRSE